MNPLDQLRDIHTTNELPWWPLAPGWWIVALLLAIVVGFLLHLLWRYWQRLQQRRAIVQTFEHLLPQFNEHGDHRRLAMDADMLLRRLVLHRGTREVASLTGVRWLEHWGSHAEDPMGQLLITAPYRTRSEFDSQAFHDWLMQKVRAYV